MILNANALHMPLAPKSIHCVVTSPPYWRKRLYEDLVLQMVFGGKDDCAHEWREQRYYVEGGGAAKKSNEAFSAGGEANAKRIKEARWFTEARCLKCKAWRGDLGSERSIGLFVKHLVKIFREVRRVLRDDGVVFVNLGDTYYAGGSKRARMHKQDVCGIPWRFAVAMQKDGWHLKRDVVWKKETAMPESVNGVRWERHRIKVKSLRTYKQKTSAGIADGRRDHTGDFRLNPSAEYEDCPGCEKCNANGGYILRRGSWRPTTAHEYIFMFTKKGKYFCNAEAGRKPLSPKTFTVQTLPTKGNGTASAGERWNTWVAEKRNGRTNNLAGANMRSVLTFPAENLKEEHYAAYPSSLPETFIAVATSEKGCCAACGAPWAPVVKISGGTTGKAWHDHQNDLTVGHRDEDKNAARGYDKDYKREVSGWKPTCSCATEEVVPCTVLDPFMGSGRTAEAAIRLHRRWIGLDLSLKYCRMATRRIAGAMTKDGKVLYAEHTNGQRELFEKA